MKNGLLLYPSGRLIDPWSLYASDVCIEDIAHVLAMTPRFGGATHRPYSVAEHSMAVCERVAHAGPRAALQGLLHDAAEAYIGDIRAPIKMRPEFRIVRDVEWAILQEIHVAFHLPLMRSNALVEAADAKEAQREAAWLMPAHRCWEEQFGALDGDVGDPPPMRDFETARSDFLAMFRRYQSAIDGGAR